MHFLSTMIIRLGGNMADKVHSNTPLHGYRATAALAKAVRSRSSQCWIYENANHLDEFRKALPD
jgi:hypothetical protein